MSTSHRLVPVVESSQPWAVRFAAHDAAATLGFGSEDIYRVGLIATELATNLVKHAVGGQVLVRPVRGRLHPEVELVAIDRGPGMADVARSLSDGHSTTGTTGFGLGSIQRLSDDFDVYSEAGRGTVVWSRVRASRAPVSAESRLDIAALSIAKDGENVSGDGWQVYHHVDGALVIMTDGLGHGIQAHEASAAAMAAVDPPHASDLAATLQTMHAGMRHTRGAAAALADIRVRPGVMKFAGIGNISASICCTDAIKHAVSLSGILGHEVRQFREYSYPWELDATFVMHSDGLATHWTLGSYRGLRQRHPMVTAAVLYRDFSRQRDDVTVLVGRVAA